jgi:hypothetical protein
MDELVSKLASFVKRSGGDHVSPCRQTGLQAGRPENLRSFLDEDENIGVISDLRRDANEICALPGSYAAYIGNSVATFRYNLSIQTSRVR